MLVATGLVNAGETKTWLEEMKNVELNGGVLRDSLA
jgi:hypothetical protein